MVLIKQEFKLRLFALVLAGLNLWSTAVVAQSVYSEAYTFSTLAGSPPDGSADGVGNNARFFYPKGIAVDQLGNLYVADTENDTIRKITEAGVVSTIAGFAGSPGSADGTNDSARFNSPDGMAVDTQGNVYVCDTGNETIRELQQVGTNWVTTTIAGLAGNYGNSNGAGTNAQFGYPTGITVDPADNLYVADAGNAIIREITLTGSNWVVSTISGMVGMTGTADGMGTNAQYEYPTGIALDNAGDLFVADESSDSIREIMPQGGAWASSTVTTFGSFSAPDCIAVDSATNLYVGGYFDETISKISLDGGNWEVSVLAGSDTCFSCFADGTGTNALFQSPAGITVDPVGTLFVCDMFNNAIRVVTSGGVVSTLAGMGVSAGSLDGTGTAAQFFDPLAVAVDGAGNIYVADRQNYTVRKVTSAGVVSTVAGLAHNYGTNDGTGSYARFSGPTGVAVDAAGNVYVTDLVSLAGGSTVREITPGGVVTTIATGFKVPAGIAVDASTNLFVADDNTASIWELSPAGNSWDVHYITGQIQEPWGVAADSAGNVYVTDLSSDSIMEITLTNSIWEVSNIAGGAEGSADGIGTNAQFEAPCGLAVDEGGNLFVGDSGNELIRKITPVGSNWIVSTIGGLAGHGGGSDGTGEAARFYSPDGVAVNLAGEVYVADSENNSIRQGVFSQYSPANPVPFSQPPVNGQLTVTLLPPEAGGQWRFPWEVAWRNSGATASNLVQGEYTVEFSTVPGYLVLPLPGRLAITNGATTFLTNTYYPTITTVDTNNGGSLTVYIEPSPPTGAGWRFLGGTNAFYPPDFSTNVMAGTYLIEFAPVSGFTTPSSLSVQVVPGSPTVLTITYLLAQSPPTGVLLPAPVPSGDISDLTDYPYGFNGQLQTDVGYGSGVAVATNVVLTAAHLVFNDQTLSYVSQAYWFYQEQAGVFTPDPMLAQGWYVLSGYASQRTNDILGGLGPDQSSPQSRNFDVAALYFSSPVANGGYGGCLPSDAAPNSWLTSTAQKMLVGYPVDGSQFGFTNIVNGQMYEIGPQPYPLSQASDPVADQQVYTASWFLSYPGNSGGPFYVQLNGYYYPAGVYLGTLFNGVVPYASAVRAIDSNVVNLITLAASLGNSGTNNSGGGVITVVPGQGIVNNPAVVEVTIAPPAAFQAGGAWKLSSLPNSDYSTQNPSALAVTSTNAVQLQFKPITGWNGPANQSLALAAGSVTNLTATYALILPSPQIQTATRSGNSFTFTWSAVSNQVYQIQFTTNLTQTNWTALLGALTATNSTASISEAITNNAQQFYRVVVLP